MNELEKQNNFSGNSFVKSITGKHGYARWDKAFTQLRKSKYATSFSKMAGEGSDTIVIVPLVKDGDEQVEAYLEAHLSEEVKINLRTAGEYRRMSFKHNGGVYSVAEKHALRLMQLNMMVNGDSSYKIIDNRLFNGSLKNNDSIHSEKLVKFSAEKLQSLVYVENCITLLSWKCPYINDPVYCKPDCDRCFECREHDVNTTYCDGYWDDGGGSSGGVGGEGPGDTGGGGPGTGGNDDPCNGGGIIINGILPPDPCDTGGGDEPGWLPFFEDDGDNNHDYPPPFIWKYNGENNSEVVVDNFPYNKPTFQFLSSDNYESKYPRFTDLVKNLKSFTMSNRKVMEALKKWSGLSQEKIIEYLSFGNGPIIKIGSLPGALGWYRSNKNPAILNVRDTYVNLLETTPSLYVKEALAFLLSVTVLHEFVHFGAHVSGISEGAFEFGQEFEKEAFNVVVSFSNMGKLYLDFYKYY